MSDTPIQTQPTEDLTHIGSYTIESSLGQGGMGIVYRATDKNLGRQVAIKVLHPHLLRHENLKQRFRREARMHGKLMHPNIVTLLSLFEDDSHMALVMELVEGVDLKKHLKDNPELPLRQKLKIAADVLTGLGAAHEHDMVHRDLKPANVLVSNTGEVKLLDFGLAKPEAGEDDLTQSGATVGSFRYMAPEQILNKPIDARTDLYAFGILLFYMTLGKLPFDATSNGGEFEIMEKQVREPAPIPKKLDASIPNSLSDLILKLLSKSKLSRPDTADAVRRKILDIIEKMDDEEPDKVLKTKHKTKKRDAQNHPSQTSIMLPALSNSDIAKQWVKHGQANLGQLWALLSPKLNKLTSGLSGIAIIFMCLGAIVIAVLSMAENNAVKTDESRLVKATSTASQPAIKEQPLKKVKPTIKTVKTKPIISKKVTPKVKKPKAPIKSSQPKSITFQVPHRVARSDKSEVNTASNHEFRGGSHTFFPELSKKSWLTSSKRGETKIVFRDPQALSRIVLNKVSVGNQSFKKGYIYLEIQAPNSNKWLKLFERKGKAINKRITIRKIQKHMPRIQAIRIRFKTPNPISIGPIDLYQ